MRNISLLLILSLTLSSCASILNSRYQKVTVNSSKPYDKILVNGEEAKMKDGRYMLRRDRLPKQLTVKREGFKDENVTMVQYKKSPLHILSWVPFGIFIFTPFYDVGSKSFDYDKEVTVGKNLASIPQKDEEARQIKLSNVSINLKSDNLKYKNFHSFRNYKRTAHKRVGTVSSDNSDVSIENTVFSGLLNDVLKGKGYIDTTNRVFKNSYLNNLVVEAEITDYTLSSIGNLGYTYYTYANGLMFVDLQIKWNALDLYGKPVYTHTSNVSSGQFAVTNYKQRSEIAHTAIKDAMEYGLIDFINSDTMVMLLHDKSDKTLEASFESLTIPAASDYVTSLSEAIRSSVTIKNSEGHGSGFVVSSTGHIITNYHVVSDSSKLKVITNDEKEYEVQILRVSKIHDLALLKINAKDLKPFKLKSSKDIQVALDIYAIGTPSSEDLSQTISKGIISGIRKVGEDAKLIQTDASVNGGNSGGAIVNKEGEVVGVVSSKLKGFGIEGVAFGIPSYEVFERLKIKVL